MDSWPYEISTFFISASPDSFFASEIRTSQSQTGSCQNCMSLFTSAHSSLQLCTRSSHRELGCLGSIGEILLSVTVMKVLNNFFKHWLILEEMGAGGTTGQSIPKHGCWCCFTPGLCFKHAGLMILTIYHYVLDPSSPCSTILQLPYL